jgi:hypothetical protein
VLSLQEITEALSFTDVILEPNVLSLLRSFISKKGVSHAKVRCFHV